MRGPSGLVWWTLRFTVRSVPGLLFGIVPSVLATNPREMAENWPRWLAWGHDLASQLARLSIPPVVVASITSERGRWACMAIGLLVIAVLNLRATRAAARAARPQPSGRSAREIVHDDVLWTDGGRGWWGRRTTRGPFCPIDRTRLLVTAGRTPEAAHDRDEIGQGRWLSCPACGRRVKSLGSAWTGRTIGTSRAEARAMLNVLDRR